MGDNTKDDGKRNKPLGWTLKDRVSQLEETVRLYEGHKDWTVKLRQEGLATGIKEVRALNKRERLLRVRVQTLKDGERHGIDVLLKQDPYLEFRCKGKSIEEIESIAQQAIFLKRKELDRLSFELQQKQGVFLNFKYKVESTELTRQVDVTPLIHKTQEIETQLKNIKSKHQAALLLKNTYEKIRSILIKDATHYDAVLTEAYDDLVLQCKNVIKALELGQRAVEERSELKEKIKQMHEEYAELVTQREMQINTIKRKLNKVRQKSRELGPIAAILEDEATAGRSEIEDLYIAGLKEERNQLQSAISVLKDITSTKSAQYIVSKVEHTLYKKGRLQRQTDINISRLETELIQKRRKEIELENLLNTNDETLRGYQDEAWYEAKTEEYNHEIEKIKQNMGFDSRIMFMIQMTLYDILSNMRHIIIDTKNTIEERPIADDPLTAAFLEPTRPDYEIVLNEINYDDKKFIYTVTLLDVLIAKVDLVKHQLAGIQPTRRSKSFSSSRRGSRLRGHDKKSVTFQPAKPVVVNPCPPDLVWRKEIAEGREFEGHKLPTRVELKKRSNRLVDQYNEKVMAAKKALRKRH